MTEVTIAEVSATSELAERVQRGAELLDRHWSTWYLDVHLETLDVRRSMHCVATQLDVAHGVDELDPRSVWRLVQGVGGARHHGLYLDASLDWRSDAEYHRRYGELTEEWRRLIRRRRSETTDTEPRESE